MYSSALGKANSPSGLAFVPFEIVDGRLRESMERTRVRLYIAFMLLDVAIIAFCGMAPAPFRNQPFFSYKTVEFLMLVLPIYVAVSLNSQAYSLRALRNPNYGAVKVLSSILVAAVTSAGLLFYTKQGDPYSRLAPGLSTLLTLVLLPMARVVIGNWIGRRYDRRFTTDVVLVDDVSVKPHHNEIVVEANRIGLFPTAIDPVILDQVGHAFRNCDRIILSCSPARRAAWIAMLKGTGVRLETIAPELNVDRPLAIDQRDGDPTLIMAFGPFALVDRIMKRALDLALTVPAIILLLPVFAVIALAIRIESPGPVLFKQARVGRGNRSFLLYKFRSMGIAPPRDGSLTLTQLNDHRVTRIGSFLRRSSLDELPQLLNVLKGEMSLAGPRPHAAQALAGGSLYWEVDERYFHRHSVKPGLTGLAQIRGYRGTTFEHKDLADRLHADLEYVAGWSIWRDVVIILKTLRVVVHKNAF